MKEFVVLYIIYKNQVYYLRKIEGKISKLDNKLVGLGGKVETNENIFDALIRETKEEINLELKKKDLIYRGILHEFDEMKKIHFFILKTNNKIKEFNIENEGKTQYYSLNYYKLNPKEFPKGDIEILDNLFSNDSFFEFKIKDGKIKKI